MMTTPRLIMLRLFNVTLGRSASANRLLRWLLVELLIRTKKGKAPYVASSLFFDFADFGEGVDSDAS